MKKFKAFLHEDVITIPDWWKALTRASQLAYLELHPASQYKDHVWTVDQMRTRPTKIPTMGQLKLMVKELYKRGVSDNKIYDYLHKIAPMKAADVWGMFQDDIIDKKLLAKVDFGNTKKPEPKKEEKTFNPIGTKIDAFKAIVLAKQAISRSGGKVATDHELIAELLRYHKDGYDYKEWIAKQGGLENATKWLTEYVDNAVNLWTDYMKPEVKKYPWVDSISFRTSLEKTSWGSLINSNMKAPSDYFSLLYRIATVDGCATNDIYMPMEDTKKRVMDYLTYARIPDIDGGYYEDTIVDSKLGQAIITTFTKMEQPFSKKEDIIAVLKSDEFLDSVNTLNTNKKNNAQKLVDEASAKLSKLMKPLEEKPFDGILAHDYFTAQSKVINEIQRVTDYSADLSPIYAKFPDSETYFKNTTKKFFGDAFKSPEIAASGDAIEEYKGSGYIPINKALRSSGWPEDILKQQIENATVGVWGSIKDLDRAFEKFKMPSDGIFFRGAKIKNFNVDDLVPGTVIEDKAYVSSSLRKGVAENFSTNILFRINTPKGAHVIPLNSSEIPPFYGTNNSECEFLFPRGSKFKITKVANRHTGIEIEGSPDDETDLVIDVDLVS